MASPVTTFRVRSVCVFFFHCWSSTCRMKWICCWERPSLVGSILVAKGAVGSFGVLSAIPAVSGAWKVVPQQLHAQYFKWSTGSAAPCVAQQYVVRSALSATKVVCEWNKIVQHLNEPPLQWRFLQGDGWIGPKVKSAGTAPSSGKSDSTLVYFGVFQFIYFLTKIL